MLEYGVRGHDFGRMTALELGEAIAARGIAWVQLALAKALTTPDCRTGNLSPGLAKRIAGDLGRSGVGIAVLGCYINPVDEDAGAREAGLARFREHLRYARDFGCPLVATETGWRGRSEVAIQPLGPWGDPDDSRLWPEGHVRSDSVFSLLVDSVGSLVREAEKCGSIVAIEPVTRHTIHSPARMKRLLEAIPSPALQVLLDPINLLDGCNWQKQQEIVDECFDLFGDRIVAVHAKDFLAPPRGSAISPETMNLRTVAVGQGSFDWAHFLARLTKRKPFIQTLLEDCPPDQVAAARGHLEGILASLA